MPYQYGDTANARIINFVRDNAGLDYQNRVPVATQSNLSDTLKAIQSYEPNWNTFVNVLLDQCCLPLYRRNSWTNDLAKFKTARIRNGSWVQEVGFGLIQAHSYDKSATNVFGLREPEVATYFHRQNRKDKYAISVDEEGLAQAFVTDGELSSFVSGILTAVQNSDNVDEYLIMRELFAHYQNEYGFYNYQIPNLSTSSDLKSDTQKITQILKEVAGYMKYPTQNAKYNKAGLPYVGTELVFITTPYFLSRNDVYNLASAFNVEYGRFVGDILQEVDEIPIDGCQALLVDRDWFVCTDTRIRQSAVYNDDNMVTNHFLHHWGVYSTSLLAPCAMLSLNADSTWEITTPTYSSVSLALGDGATYAERGATTKIVATVAGTNNPNQAVTYELMGTDGIPLSTNTHIDGSGNLWVGSDERNAEIIVKATSIGDPTKSASLGVGIGAAAATGSTTAVAVTSTNSEIDRGATEQFTATTTPAGGSVVWAVAGAGSNTFIDSAGLLHVAEDEPNAGATVIAISADTPSVMGSKAVTFADPE